jgi:oxygen-independent coproporphyrinogen-3 oxidase
LAGIYFHIPFCRRKCHYCNFFSLASQKQTEPFIRALKQEIKLTRNYLEGEEIKTIYFGGGTPSVYRPEILQEVIGQLIPHPPTPSPGRRGGGRTSISHRLYPPQPLPAGREGLKGYYAEEVSLELNPDDVTIEYVAELKDTWFNRFSVGVQSFHDGELSYLNRSHDVAQAIRAVSLLQEAGYENISIDLIYGIPGSNEIQWQQTLEIAFSLDVPHISAYALTVEQGTPLAWMIDKKRSTPVEDELQANQFRWLMEAMQDHGYHQYEISNFCKPGWHAVHNTNYWMGVPYLGLGPSAHSYDGKSRRWNVSNLTKYLAGIETGKPVYEEEMLSDTQRYNEYVMTSLRTMWGCDSHKIISDFGFQISDLFRKSAMPFIHKGWLREDSGVYFLTDEGKLFADCIASELFL